MKTHFRDLKVRIWKNYTCCFIQDATCRKFCGWLNKTFSCCTHISRSWKLLAFTYLHTINQHRNAWEVSLFVVFLVCIFLHSDWIRTRKYHSECKKNGAVKLRIQTLFAQSGKWKFYQVYWKAQHISCRKLMHSCYEKKNWFQKLFSFQKFKSFQKFSNSFNLF